MRILVKVRRDRRRGHQAVHDAHEQLDGRTEGEIDSRTGEDREKRYQGSEKQR